MALKSLDRLLEEAREYLIGIANPANVDALLESVRQALVIFEGAGHLKFFWQLPSVGRILGT